MFSVALDITLRAIRITSDVAPIDFQRFIEAQYSVYDDVRTEIAASVKAGHWMWFVFPQLQGLGRSSMAIRCAIAAREGAEAYWQHPILSARMNESVELVLAVKGKTAFQIFGTPDDLKLRSPMTQLSYAVPDGPLLMRALVKYFDGRDDAKTMELLGRR